MSKLLTPIIKKTSELLNMEVPEIIRVTMKSTAEGLTGITKSEPKDLLTSLGNIAQRIIAGQQLDSVLVEWEKLKEKGKIKNDYASCIQAKYTLLELLRFLDGDSDIPDEDRFQILKKIMLIAATEEKYDRNSVKPLQFMKLVKTLSSGDILVMLTCHHFVNNPPQLPISDNTIHVPTNSWREVIAEKSGLGSVELVANFEDHLMEKRVLNGYSTSDKSGVRITPYFRLSSLGYEICEYISLYDKFETGK